MGCWVGSALPKKIQAGKCNSEKVTMWGTNAISEVNTDCEGKTPTKINNTETYDTLYSESPTIQRWCNLEPIPISSFGEISHRKPLKLQSWNHPCSLRITDQYFELLWADTDSARAVGKTKKSIQCTSQMVYMSGSVVGAAKSWDLHPSKLIISMCGVEQGLTRGLAGTLRTFQTIDFSARTSNMSTTTSTSLTPSWFACEGFLLNSTPEDTKRILKDFYPGDIVEIIWEFLGESRFTNGVQQRGILNHQAGYPPHDDKILLKPFCLVPKSKSEMTLSNLDLGADVYSNVDARCSSIRLSNLNGTFTTKDRSAIKRIKLSQLSQRVDQSIKEKPRKCRSSSTTNITLHGDKDQELSEMRGFNIRNSQSKGKNLQLSGEASFVSSHNILSNAPDGIWKEQSTISDTVSVYMLRPSWPIDDFEERIRDAVLTALAADENECYRIIKLDKGNLSKSSTLVSFGEFQPRAISLAVAKTEVRLMEMILLPADSERKSRLIAGALFPPSLDSSRTLGKEITY